MKNAVFWDIKTQFLPHRRHIAFPLQSPDCYVSFEVFTSATMKNVAFWDVTPCGSCNNGCFRGTYDGSDMFLWNIGCSKNMSAPHEWRRFFPRQSPDPSSLVLLRAICVQHKEPSNGLAVRANIWLAFLSRRHD
jgi:hypothetical protein